MVEKSTEFLRGGTTKQTHETNHAESLRGNGEEERRGNPKQTPEVQTTPSLRGQDARRNDAATSRKQTAETNHNPASKETRIPTLRFKEFDGEWDKSKLRAVSKITTGSTPSTKISEFYNGSFLFVSPADMQGNRYIKSTKTTLTEAGFDKCRKLKKGSVLFVCIGSTIGKVAQSFSVCSTNQQINALEAKENFSNDFLYSLLEKNGQRIKLLAGVQAVPQINKTDFSNLKYFFPSLPEQQKIASFLAAVDKKIQQLTKKKELLEDYKKGVMQQLFSGKLRFKDQTGKEFPDWEEKRLGEYLEERVHYSEKELPLYSLTIENGIIPKSQRYERSFLVKNVQKAYKVMLENDFAFNPMNLRFGALARLKNANEVAVSKYYNIFYCKDNADKLYMETYLTSYNMIQYYNKMSTGSLEEKKRVHYLDFIKFKLLFPSLEEQQKIANYLSAIDTKIEAVNQQIEKTQEFKKGLLQRMFV